MAVHGSPHHWVPPTAVGPLSRGVLPSFVSHSWFVCLSEDPTALCSTARRFRHFPLLGMVCRVFPPCTRAPRPAFCLHPLSFAFAALKPEFKQKLKNEKAEEGATARFRCEVTVAKAPVVWQKGGVDLQPGDKYEMREDGTSRQLLIHSLEPEDSGEYCCTTGDQTTSAALTVKGKRQSVGHGHYCHLLVQSASRLCNSTGKGCLIS